MLIGVDVGGTFTDLVLSDEEGALRFVKAPSTPDDPSRGVMDALTIMADELGESIPCLLGRVDIFIHGTTVATNILVQRTGARLGLITTSGFRDLLELRDGSRAERYALRSAVPTPIVERPLRLEVRERIDAQGNTVVPLNEEDVAGAIDRLQKGEAEAVVVCFLHAHKNAGHERRVRDAIEASGWTPFVSLSHEVLCREGEYDRLSTAVVNSYVGPGLRDYLRRLERTLEANGITVPVFVMQSTGGVLPIVSAARHAVGAVTSGPAGGAMCAALFARSLELAKVVTYDTGGTSTDISIVENGAPVERMCSELSGLRITAPAIDVNPIGIGGGSIARVDASGILAIGPNSAGAAPGPACFCNGGISPTLTDANLVLGLISPNGFLGGRMRLSVEAARKAIEEDVAGPLGVGVEEAAWAIHVLASSRITEGVRMATVRRGQDPRDVSLMSFGGAGGLHTSAVARELQIPKAIVPRMASVLSALGFLATDVRKDLDLTLNCAVGSLSEDELATVFERLEAEGRALLSKAVVRDSDIVVERRVECRYGRQMHCVSMPLTGSNPFDPAGLGQRFARNYRALYGHVHEEAAAIIDTCRVSVFAPLPKIALPQWQSGPPDPSPAARGRRRAYLGGPLEIETYAFDALQCGMRVEGPAIIESASTTILVATGDVVSVDRFGSVVIERAVA